MNKYEGIVDLILLENHDEEGNTFLSVKFYTPEEWELPLTEDGYRPWLSVVKHPSVIKAVKAAADQPVKMTSGGNRYRFIGTFRITGKVAGRRFFVDSLVPAKADYILDKDDDGVTLD